MERAYEKLSYKAEDGGGRRVELEAAEALAALAHLSSNRETDDFAGDKLGGCSSQPVNNKSSSADTSDLAKVDEDGSAAIPVMKRSSVNSEQEVVRNPSFMCNRGHLSVSGNKSPHCLAEADKEERRIRRVLANRESARQTIRRRQAMHEKLTRKAADLAMENENLKSEKGQALREYDSLKSINDRLKARVAEMDKAGAKENQGDLRSTCGKGSTSTSQTSALPCNRPSVVPCFWRSSIQPSDAFFLPCSCQKCISIASQVHVQAMAKTDTDHEQQYARMSFQTGNPIYVLPFPWFFPFHAQCDVHNLQSSDHNTTQDKAFLNFLCSTDAHSKAEVQMENQHLSLTAKTNLEVPSPTEMKSSFHETRCSFPQDEGSDTRTTRSVLNLAARPVASPEKSHKPQENFQGHIGMIPVAPGAAPKRMLEKNEGPVIFTSGKCAGAIVAAEARKRRKELTKLKNLYYSGTRMH